MQSETQLDASFGGQSIGISQESRPQPVGKSAAKPKPTSREAKFDKVSTAVVIGGTAQFVTFIFGLVTEFVPFMFGNILLSAVIGIVIGLVAYVLMKESD